MVGSFLLSLLHDTILVFVETGDHAVVHEAVVLSAAITLEVVGEAIVLGV